MIAALDVGSSKVCCLVARIGDSGPPRVIGIGQQASRGVKSGNVVDMEAAENAILIAVHAAEQMAGETIESVFVNLSGGQPASRSMSVEVSIAGHAVEDTDLRRILEQSRYLDNELGLAAQGSQPTSAGNGRATSRHGLNGHGSKGHGSNGHESNGRGTNGQARSSETRRQLIHSIPVGYSIDGSHGIRDPRGMYGETLGVNLHLVTAAVAPMRNLATCIKRCHLDVDGFVVSPYASGLSALVEDEMELGVTLIDMGGGTTTIAVFQDGSCIHTDVIPVGGQHVTSDVARGLSTPLAHAERLKTLYGHAIAATADSHETIEVPGVGENDQSPQHISRSLLTGIIQPRLEETFELARSHLEASGYDKLAGRRVVLTGGASQVPGLRDLAGLVLDKQVRIGRPTHVAGLAEATGGPAYATAAGLLNYALEADVAAPEQARPETGEPDGFMGRIGHWIREHF
jgi:cell division protein FtsA